MEGREFDKNTQPDEILDESLLSTFNNNGFKKGKIKSVTSSLPYNDKKPWKVFVSIKAGTWPFTDKEEEIEIFSILDNELEELNEYNEFKKNKMKKFILLSLLACSMTVFSQTPQNGYSPYNSYFGSVFITLMTVFT